MTQEPIYRNQWEDSHVEFLEQLQPELLDPEVDIDPNLPKHSVHFQDW